MNRRRCLRSLLAIVPSAFLTSTLFAQVIDGKVTLRDRLKAGLLCRRPEEFEFVDHVVDLVDQKELTEALVLSTYKWSVQQRANFPFFYFREAIRRRAKEIGVQV